MLRFPGNKLTGLPPVRYQEEEQTIAEGKPNGGLVTSIDPADLENKHLTDAKNVRVKLDRTNRRPGNLLLTPAKPDSNKVLLIAPWEHFDNSLDLLRFTPSSVYRRTVGAWNAIVGALTGGANDRFNAVIANDRFFFSNNGKDPIQEINIGALTFAQAGNAPRYKYIIGFNNRIVGANLHDTVAPIGIKIGWSGNLNFTQWDSAVDPSAGSLSLIDSTTDFSDDITGLFSFSDTALILRERSLWGIGKQPIASDPFHFFPISSGIGCDCPFSAIAVSNGIAWFDLRTKTVWHYKIGMQQPERIGILVEEMLSDSVLDVNQVFGAYDTVNDEYTLAIANDTTTVVRMWVYNFNATAWSYDEQLNISALSNADSSATLVIDDLVGMIDDLAGFIDDLGASVTRATKFFGKTDGEITVESELSDTDAGATYTTTIASKLFKVPQHKGYIKKLYIEYIPKLGGSFTASYSKDGGATWRAYKTISFDNTMINKRKVATFVKHLSVNEYMWKIESTAGVFDIVEFSIAAIPSNAQQKSR